MIHLRKTRVWTVRAALCLLVLLPPNVRAADDEYWKVVSARAAKIVESLELRDAVKELRVQDIIAMQYVKLSEIHDRRDKELEKIAEIENPDFGVKEKMEMEIQINSEEKLGELHRSYLESLSEELSPDQIDLVKDGMTYGVLDHTYKAYTDLLPELTDSQKNKIMEWLVEAREIAMDQGSSEEKHAVFGKYKGKINNYLSAEGYDLKKAELERK